MTPCIEWTGARNVKGYGARQWRGHVRRAHRVAWEEANGPIPDGMMVLHRCDNPPCVNVAHLFLGTAADNTADMIAKGRRASVAGEKNAKAKLTLDQVRSIREAHAAGVSNATQARTYGVTRSTIRHIVIGLTWKIAYALNLNKKEQQQ